MRLQQDLLVSRIKPPRKHPDVCFAQPKATGSWGPFWGFSRGTNSFLSGGGGGVLLLIRESLLVREKRRNILEVRVLRMRDKPNWGSQGSWALGGPRRSGNGAELAVEPRTEQRASETNKKKHTCGWANLVLLDSLRFLGNKGFQAGLSLGYHPVLGVSRCGGNPCGPRTPLNSLPLNPQAVCAF